MAAQKKKRATNWSSDEISTFVDAINERRAQILGSFSPSVTKETRLAAWVEIVRTVNCVNITGYSRNLTQCEHKWWDIRASARKREAAWRRIRDGTGGGPPTCPPTALDGIIIGMIGKESVSGVPGAEDWLTSVFAKTEAAHARIGPESGGPSNSELTQLTTLTRVGDTLTAASEEIVHDVPLSSSQVDALNALMEQLPTDRGTDEGPQPARKRRKRSSSNQDEIVVVQGQILQAVQGINQNLGRLV